jgi:DNA-binding transcriptional LysR family regulator
MLDRYLIRYFLAVVDQGNFTRAAALCHVSQPTLSVGIAKLEGQLGAPLFLRSNQRVELTGAGARFLVHARRIESEYNLAERALAEAEPVCRLRIGWLLSIPAVRLAQALAPPDRQPGRADPQVEIVEGTERELQGALARGRIDFAVSLVRAGETRFVEEAVLTEGYRLALPAGHALAGADSVAAEALAAETMIVRRHCEALAETSRHFTERGVRPFFAMRSIHDERVMAMVAAGLGITLMPESCRHPGIAWPRLAGFDLRRTLGFLFAPDGGQARLAGLPLLARIRAALAG